MSDKIKVATTSDIPPGSMKSFNVAGKSIMICNVGDKYFALDDTCTHEHCSLGTEGFLDGEKIICGCHGAQFNGETGKVLSPPATTDLKTYKTTTSGSDIFIEM